MSPLRDAKMHARTAVWRSSPWIERLARAGFVARGIVYVVIGVLAVQAAIGAGGRTTSPQGAIVTVGALPLGKPLLAVMALGLFGFALWRFIEAALDPEHPGSDPKRLVVRLGYAASGVIHAALGVTALQLLGLASRGGGGSDEARHWTARALTTPFGEWLVGLAGAVVIAVGVAQIYMAYKCLFREQLKLGEMSADERAWATRSGRFGLAARGVVFDIMGLFLILAALRSDPSEARGLDGALASLAAQPFGQVLLAAVALGLVAFGLYSFVEARYRRILAR